MATIEDPEVDNFLGKSKFKLNVGVLVTFDGARDLLLLNNLFRNDLSAGLETTEDPESEKAERG